MAGNHRGGVRAGLAGLVLASGVGVGGCAPGVGYFASRSYMGPAQQAAVVYGAGLLDHAAVTNTVIKNNQRQQQAQQQQGSNNLFAGSDNGGTFVPNEVRNGRILNVEANYYAEEEDVRGIEFKIKFEVNHAQGRDYAAIVYFYDDKKHKLIVSPDVDYKFRADDNQLAVGFEPERAPYEKTVFSDVVRFVPHDIFAVPDGEKRTFFYRVEVHRMFEGDDAEVIAESNWAAFSFSRENKK